MKHFAIAVLGAGPAGTEAALTAAACGLSVLLIDEQDAAGGQVHRAPAPGLPQEPGTRPGALLRRRLADSAVVCAFGHRVWHVDPGFSIATVGPEGPDQFTADRLIVATGALERHCPVPGWTLPGVFGLAAATILLKAHRVLPGQRVGLAGSGPLLALVANGILDLGGALAFVADAAGRRDWLGRAAPMLTSPALALRGAAWLARLVRAGVPLFSRHALRRIDGGSAVATATIGPLDTAWRPVGGPERQFHVDSICTGYGLVPSTDVTRLLGAAHRFDTDTAGWTADTDAEGHSTVPGLHVCGDGAGVAGANAAPASGRKAALAAARALGAAGPQTGADRWAARRRAAFGMAMTRLSVPGPGASDWSDGDTLLCRCENVPRSRIEAAVRGGATSFNEVKSVTRCGMGGCGGRICGEPVSALIARLANVTRPEVGLPTGRSPLRPVVLDQIAGPFDYDSLPFPPPAPA